MPQEAIEVRDCERAKGRRLIHFLDRAEFLDRHASCLLYTSDAADERSSVDLGGRRIIKKKTAHTKELGRVQITETIARR